MSQWKVLKDGDHLVHLGGALEEGPVVKEGGERCGIKMWWWARKGSFKLHGKVESEMELRVNKFFKQQKPFQAFSSLLPP